MKKVVLIGIISLAVLVVLALVLSVGTGKAYFIKMDKGKVTATTPTRAGEVAAPGQPAKTGVVAAPPVPQEPPKGEAVAPVQQAGQPAETGVNIEQLCADECSYTGKMTCSISGTIYGTEVQGLGMLWRCGNYDIDNCLEWDSGTGCAYGCENGACLLCSNECAAGQTKCDGNLVKTCGNYDTDSCLEWDAGTRCTYGCANARGVCQASRDDCTNDCNTAGQTKCDGNLVKTCGDYDGEDSCLEWSAGTLCPNGCGEGFCLSCSESDGGVNFDVKEITTRTYNKEGITFVFDTLKEEFCYYGSNFLMEFYNCGRMNTTYDCAKQEGKVCRDGACVAS